MENPTLLKAWSLYFPNEEYTIFNKEISLIIEIRKALGLDLSTLRTILDTGIYECEYAFFSRFLFHCNNGNGNNDSGCNGNNDSGCNGNNDNGCNGNNDSDSSNINITVNSSNNSTVNSSNNSIVNSSNNSTVNSTNENIINNNNSKINTTNNNTTNKININTKTTNTGTLPPFECFSCAVSEKIYENFQQLVKVETRIINHNEISSFNDVSTSKVDTLITLIGTCCRVGFKKIENLVSFFECTKCARILSVNNLNNLYRLPKCPCKSKNFIFLSGHPENKCVDKQEIKIQEIFTNENNTKILEVDLYGSLVGMAAPGDLIQLTGIIRAELGGDGYRLKVECNNLQVIKNRNHFKDAEGLQNDFEVFKKISAEPNLISVFINNLYPNIYGNTLIKAGLILSLFGGSRKFVGSHAVRSEIHVLIIGDPGLGKSKILLNTSGVLPKSTYISGNFCTTAGLTVSISHDPVTGEFMADAGALVVSDGGVCCIDEFDKIDDHTSLFEAMEDQRVTVAKGGVCCSVPTRATVIAASNPKNGHFDTKKTILENLKFEPGLISRFDMVFVLRDDLNEQENYEIGNHILKKRHYSTEDSVSSLIRNLRTDAFIMENDAVYSQDILKRYIEYARMTVNPILSKAARQKIKEYYVELRKDKNVSVRNLESLIRLTESCAKMELKSVASLAHAQFAINLYKKAFISEESGDTGQKKGLDKLLREFVEDRGAMIEKEELVELIEKSSSKKTPGEVIEMLNFQGTIVQKGKNQYKIMISN